MLECWVQDSVDGVLLSWIWGWVHAVVGIHESINFLSDLLVTNISLLGERQVLEAWVEMTIVGVLFSWVWGWMHTVVSIDESNDSLLNLLVSNVSFLSK